MTDSRPLTGLVVVALLALPVVASRPTGALNVLGRRVSVPGHAVAFETINNMVVHVCETCPVSVCFVRLSSVTTDGSVDVRGGVLNEFSEATRTREEQSDTEQDIDGGVGVQNEETDVCRGRFGIRLNDIELSEDL